MDVVVITLVLLGLWAASLALTVRLVRRHLAKAPSSNEEYRRSLAQVRASRREIVDAFEIERRRIERDLHDGAQQYLVATSMKLGEAAMLWEIPDQQETARELVTQAQADVDAALQSLRATVAGIHPRVLTERGLEAAVRDVAHRSPVDVHVRAPHPLPPLPASVAAVGYFFVSEALTNAAKYAGGAPVTVLLAVNDTLRISVLDEGPGGAHIQSGHGLAGMRERLAAFGGEMTLTSPAGGPTTVSATIPLLLDEGTSAVHVTERNPQ